MELILSTEETQVPENIQPAIKLIRKPKVKAYSAQQIINRKRVLYPFEGKWKESFGEPEKIAKWFISGPSFSGKSSLTFTLCEYLSVFGCIDYNSLEEGDSQTVADKIIRHGLAHKTNFRLLAKVPVDQFEDRLMKRKSAAFGVIDSVQHAQMNKKQYCRMVDRLCIPKKGKSMIFINHWTKDELWKHIKHDCDIKIEVINYVAYVESRFGGGKPFVIWEEGAKRKWGKKYNLVINGHYWPGQKK
jgi:hypothetical protein